MLPSVLFPVNTRIGLLPCGMSIKETVEGCHRIMYDDFVWGILEKKLVALACLVEYVKGLLSLGYKFR